MTIPNPVRLFHITAIANLPAICTAGALLSKNAGAAAGIDYQNIAHQGAQGARAGRAVPNPPGGAVHDYVPFYFAPRSPMLFASMAAGLSIASGAKATSFIWKPQRIASWPAMCLSCSMIGTQRWPSLSHLPIWPD